LGGVLKSDAGEFAHPVLPLLDGTVSLPYPIFRFSTLLSAGGGVSFFSGLILDPQVGQSALWPQYLLLVSPTLDSIVFYLYCLTSNLRLPPPYAFDPLYQTHPNPDKEVLYRLVAACALSLYPLILSYRLRISNKYLQFFDLQLSSGIHPFGYRALLDTCTLAIPRDSWGASQHGRKLLNDAVSTSFLDEVLVVLQKVLRIYLRLQHGSL